VADAGPGVSGVAGRYASALFEIAREADELDAVAADLNRFGEMIEASPDLARLVRSPVFSADDQLRAVSAVLDKAELRGSAANLIRLAARNRRLFAVPDMITAYRRLLASHRGEVEAEVTSAEPLSETHVAALREALRATLGKDVDLARKVDPALIGGLIVKVGSRMIDTSLRTRLTQLRFAMKEAG